MLNLTSDEARQRFYERNKERVGKEMLMNSIQDDR
tara:strand:+ start:572 stop:676 length:105 start_codon:yes stop_codon:yes gene_type:complete